MRGTSEIDTLSVSTAVFATDTKRIQAESKPQGPIPAARRIECAVGALPAQISYFGPLGVRIDYRGALKGVA